MQVGAAPLVLTHTYTRFVVYIYARYAEAQCELHNRTQSTWFAVHSIICCVYVFIMFPIRQKICVNK